MSLTRSAFGLATAALLFSFGPAFADSGSWKFDVVNRGNTPVIEFRTQEDGEWSENWIENRIEPGDTFELEAEVPHAERYGPEGATYWVARRNRPGRPG